MNAPFKWTGDDTLVTSRIVALLRRIGQHEHADALIEVAVELDGVMPVRAPRATDAWRYFNAARVLKASRAPAAALLARQLGRKIGLHVTDCEVIDAHHVRAGSSEAIVLGIVRPMGAR